MKVEPGPRALEARIEAIENLPRLAWSHTRHFFVQFEPNPSAPSQKPYGNKRATSVKKVGDAWGEQMLICIENESQPEDITFQVMAWRRLHHHALFGEVSISQAEMTALMAQALGFELSVCLPVRLNGKYILDDQERPCVLHMSLKVVADTTKKLLKYHPEVNLQLDVEHLMETLSVKKAQLPVWRMAFLGILSGFWMAVAGCLSFAVAGTTRRSHFHIQAARVGLCVECERLTSPRCPAGSLSAESVRGFPILPRLVMGLLSPVAMHFIVIFGGEFYSGNCM